MQHVGKLKLKDLALEPGEPPSVMRGSDLLREIIQRTGEVAYRFRLWPTFGYEYVSEAVVDLLGYSADEVYADPGLIGRLVYPDDAQLMNSVADAPGDQPLELSLRFLTRDGRVVSTELRCVVTRDLSGRATHVDGVLRNLTARDEDRQRLQMIHRRGLHATSNGHAAARVLIVDDHDLTRAGLRSLLSDDANLTVVGEAADGYEAITLARTFQPDLVLMDVKMPQMDGLEVTRRLKQVSPMTSVLVLSMFEDAELLVEAVKAGAAGYVLKGASESALRTAIWEVLAGDLAVDQRMAREVLRRLARERPQQPPTPPADVLSAREQEVVNLLARGQTNREIAYELVITPNTVKIHVEHILAKLGVSDRTQAAVRAIELGYITADHSR
jgi:DNA-binding NarL/FixJ family response regulator